VTPAEQLPPELRDVVDELAPEFMAAGDPVRAALEFARLLPELLNGASGVER